MADRPGAPPQPTRLGRYVLLDAIAWGGMATVYVGKLHGPEGFRRTVAIKRPHEHLVRDPDFSAMFLEEARLAARVRHLNVVPTLDVIDEGGEIAHVMEFVEGASLAELSRQATLASQPVPMSIVARVVADLLEGLHAAHETKDERGQPLGIVHRDVSPQNVLVGVDGLSRVLDFGVAKALNQHTQTASGRIKGKLAYVAPEYLNGAPADRRSDLYSAAVIFWELATGHFLFAGETEQETLTNVLMQPARPLRQARPDAPPALAAIVERALARDPDRRHPDARAFARDIKGATELASHEDVGTWVRALAAESIATNAAVLARAEALVVSTLPPALEAPPGPGGPPPDETRNPDSSASTSALAFPIADAPSRGQTLRGLSSQPTLTPPPARSGPGLTFFAVGLSASIALGAGLAHLWQGHPSSLKPPFTNPFAKASADHLAHPPEAAVAPHPVVAPLSSASPAAKPKSTGSLPVVASSAPSTAAVTPSAKAPPRKAPPPPPAPPSKSKTKASGASPCDPPYTYDAQGIRRIKPQCL